MFVFSFQRSLTEHKEKDNIEKVEAQVDELKGIMVRNIGKQDIFIQYLGNLKRLILKNYYIRKGIIALPAKGFNKFS